MIWLAGSLAYGVAALIAARLLTGHFAYAMAANAERKYPSLHEGRSAHPSGDQWFGAMCIAVCVAVVWPLCIALWVLPSDRIAIGAEARAISQKRQERIAALEEELGIK